MMNQRRALSCELREKKAGKEKDKIGFLAARRLRNNSGFTLVEMIVAVGLFAVVMLVCVGSLLALVGANRKVQALQSVMNNLNITLDGLLRAARMGTIYYCGNSVPSGTGLLPQDCGSGGSVFAFQPYGNSQSGNPWIYRYDSTTKQLYRRQGGLSEIPITSPQVTIDSMTFYVTGSTRGCDTNGPCVPVQPKVVIVIKGTAPVLNSKARSSFHIQVTATQRVLDL
jgi:prepilin-type N-terminal cleavage/methylation domain-containing protein